jgi:hypothetical protein
MIYACDVVLNNNTIAYNTVQYNQSNALGGGVCAYSGASYSGVNNIVYFNQCANSPNLYGTQSLAYSCSPELSTGSGNITADPQFINAVANNYNLQSTSPCIDTGDPASPPDPDGSRADMGALPYTHTVAPPVHVVLTPLSPPITIPAVGGQYSYNAAATNNTTQAQGFRAWCKIKYPNGTWTGYVLGPLNLTIPASFSVNRNRNQNVPGSWPAGQYQHWGWVAPAGTFNAYDSASFAWTKTGVDLNSPLKSWASGGDPFPGERSQTTFIPSGLIITVSPNPFNPSTVAIYKLQVADNISLKVYDTAGRLVATLVEGWRDAGEYRVTFDGSRLPSGVYLCRLEAGRQQHIYKKILKMMRFAWLPLHVTQQV